MKTITICQPYAHLIVTPESELPRGIVQKRVENRTWPTPYRGPLLIHAGKSKKFTTPDDFQTFPAMKFGAIVGVAELADCVWPIGMHNDGSNKPIFDRKDLDRFPWLPNHVHAEGPICWVLQNIRRFQRPVECGGALGLWTPSESVMQEVAEQIGLVSNPER